jgi:cobalamin biosynthetic protein CobC
MTQGWTYHGGRLSDARAAYGSGAEAWLDLSTGINPIAWPHAEKVPIDWQRLPDEKALSALEESAAAYFGVDPAHVCALPGTEIGLRLLGAILPGPARHVAPTYRTHGEMFPGAAPIALADLPSVTDGIVVLANPNNPDGRLLAPDALRSQLDRLRAEAGWLVLDEAFVDASPDYSLAIDIGDDVPLILFRSFGKFFGLAGVRLGFVLGPASLITAFRARLGAWPVSSAALAIGAAAYRDQAWIAATLERLMADKAALDTVLHRHGFSPGGESPLFRLIETGDAQALFDRLARHAILTRPFDYDPRWLRFGLPGSPEGLERLDRALADG